MSKCTSSTSVESVYTRLPAALQYFHSAHRRSMRSLVELSEAADELAEVRRLGETMGEFAWGLDMHHRIEDAQMFPPMAKKVDMSHLEAHHHALDGHLAKVIAVGSKLKNADDMKEFDKEPTTTLLKDLEKLVNDHEAAEEAVFSTENLQKHFTVEEMKKFRV